MAPASQAPASQAPPQVQAQGGDTLYLGDASQIQSYLPPPMDPAPSSNPSYAATPAVAPQPPAKKRSYGLIIFFVALLLVVVLSALGGFALRSYMRGEGQTTSDTP